MVRAHGIDVSHHHRVTDWDKLAAQGFQIFGAKATNGLGVDPTFLEHRDGARQLPFDLVTYFHFPTPKSSAVAQADHFVEQVLGRMKDNERLALDVELDQRGTARTDDDWCPDVRFVDEFVRETLRLVGDRRMFLYTSARVWHDDLGSPAWPAAIATDLWAPRYGSGSAVPLLPTDRNGFLVWPRWTMWQDSGAYSCPGVDGPCDHDVWRGDAEDLRAYVLRGGATVGGVA